MAVLRGFPSKEVIEGSVCSICEAESDDQIGTLKFIGSLYGDFGEKCAEIYQCNFQGCGAIFGWNGKTLSYLTKEEFEALCQYYHFLPAS